MQQGSRRVAAVILPQVKKEAAKMLGMKNGYSSGIMNTVEFHPDSISEGKNGVLSFPWVSRRGVLNGFKSTHGGALATLADIFTRLHLAAAAPESVLSSVSFEISYLAAVAENVECNCVTRLVNQDAGALVYMDYSFEDKITGQVFARGSHVLSCSG
ncbi:uncharacterized protein TM35_000341290 [Trypanosoma theileri]|uniref:Thioesterase domain-containing protein n=1 Tax=Trypanosoma theileri TaxID=67003 RepID=A0A1X0NLI9_9TRYP|nr:uncharacterized protein TM35_000341290 [Trypanosoma theileri]ORC85517.1 hypothetical protein TM35_000341290 [Trypanosoma theileri]